jgi:predicted GNAT family N-acyltransferase
MVKEKFTIGLPEDARMIRQKVFVDEQGYQHEFDDPDDPTAVHLVLYLDDKPIGTARLVEVDPETYRVGRVAVLKEYRHQKVGTYLLKYLEVKVKTLGGRKMILGAQEDKVQFYMKNGYHLDPNGEAYLDEGHPHVMMEKILKFKKYRRTPSNY